MARGNNGEKTEKASAKKRKDVREKGEVHKSADMCTAISLFIVFGALKIGHQSFIRALEKFASGYFSVSLAKEARVITGNTAYILYKNILFEVLPIVLPIMLVAMLGGTLAHVVQTGPLFTTNKLAPSFSRINPIEGFRRIFSASTFVELLKSIIKLVIIGWLIYKDFLDCIKVFPSLMYINVARAFLKVLSTSISMGLKIGIALVVYSAADAFYQWWKFEREIMMTKQEVREENRMMEGDPQIKARIKQQQRKMSTMRMMRSVPEADVVVTNPTHIAVALRYKEDQDNAPVVVAKGKDYLAERIKKVARQHKISIVENKPVARALYESCRVGDEIPPELYQAIADILIYVYTINGKMKGSGQ